MLGRGQRLAFVSGGRQDRLGSRGVTVNLTRRKRNGLGEGALVKPSKNLENAFRKKSYQEVPSGAEV